jgi:hypothetical protein
VETSYGMWMPEMARAITRRWISDVPSKMQFGDAIQRSDIRVVTVGRPSLGREPDPSEADGPVAIALPLRLSTDPVVVDNCFAQLRSNKAR